MSDTMLLSILRMPFEIAMATLTSRIQYHQRGVQAADEIEKRTRERNEARTEVENLYDQVHRWVDDRAKAQSQADRLREQSYELQRERAEARAEVERMREVIRTIRARCVELDDSDAVSATLDITSAVLDSKP